jgi:hypothetical protein
MRGDELSRSRSLLLARWRGAAGAVRATTHAQAVAAPARQSTAELFRLFEEEALDAVGPAMSETLRRLLETPRAALSSARDPDSYANVLVTLDLVEDVLDAVLLTGSRPQRDSEDSEKETERP